MIKKNKWQLMISSVIILLPVAAGLRMPIIFFVVHWICFFITACDPKNKDQSSKVFNMVLWIFPIISLIVCGSIYAVTLGNDINIGMMERVLLGIMFVILGNYMPKCRQNHTIGVKVRWTLQNEENWNKTHRFTGRLWVFGGILLLATMIIPMEYFMYVSFPIILLMVLAPVAYSYIYYRKQLKAGTAAGEDAVQTPSENKTAKIPLAVGTVILAFSAVFLFTGKFEVKFHEASFIIETNYWEDATINYTDIDNIEYREQGTHGFRTFGYGTPFIIMGECENREFGNYTRYAYKSCDACVVLTVNDKILVINGKDEEHTRAIYDELLGRMSG